MRKTLLLAVALTGYGHCVLAEDDVLPIMAMTYISHTDTTNPSPVRAEPLKAYYPTPRDLLSAHQSAHEIPAKTARKQPDKRPDARPSTMVADAAFYAHMMEKMK